MLGRMTKVKHSWDSLADHTYFSVPFVGRRDVLPALRCLPDYLMASHCALVQVAKATAVADEALGNVRTVRAFAMESHQVG